MAGHYDPNPFDKEDEINPFSNPHSIQPKLTPLAPEPVNFHRYGVGVPVDIPLDKASTPLDTAANLKKKEKELLAKEAELNKREEIVRKKEEALAKAGVVIEVKNWPPFCPVIHNDIAGEIPVHLQRVLYVAFATLLGVVVCLVWNIVAVSAAWIKARGDGRIFFLAIVYFLLCVPCAYYSWYRPLYRAMRTNSGFRYSWFFFFYMLHIIFFIFAAVAPPIIFNGLYFAGCLTALTVLSRSAIIGILYFIGFGLFCTEAIVSIWVFQQVYVHFRGEKALEIKANVALARYV